MKPFAQFLAIASILSPIPAALLAAALPRVAWLIPGAVIAQLFMLTSAWMVELLTPTKLKKKITP